MNARSKVPGCGECLAFDENPPEYAEKEICPQCPWGKETSGTEIQRYLNYLSMQAAGCPLGRHELTDPEWAALGELKMEREKIAFEEMEEKRGKGHGETARC